MVVCCNNSRSAGSTQAEPSKAKNRMLAISGVVAAALVLLAFAALGCYRLSLYVKNPDDFTAFIFIGGATLVGGFLIWMLRKTQS